MTRRKCHRRNITKAATAINFIGIQITGTPQDGQREKEDFLAEVGLGEGPRRIGRIRVSTEHRRWF